MIDKDGRELKNLRISVTQRCNLTCEYCHSEGEGDFGEEMSLEHLGNIIDCAALSGVEEVKITGGEPLLRSDIVEVVKVIRSNPGILDISMTTNGYFLRDYAQGLRDAGLDRINIGCDSLCIGMAKNAIVLRRGLEAVKKAGFSQTKLNMVVLKGVNDDHIFGMIEFAKEHACTLQLIELIETDKEYYEKHHVSLDHIEEKLSQIALGSSVRSMHKRRVYHFDGVDVEVVAPFKKDFCKNCNRLRVTSDGKLKPCLMRDDNLVRFNGEESLIEAMNRRELYGN